MKTKARPVMTNDDIAELRRIVAPVIEPAALRLFEGNFDGDTPAVLNTWSDGRAELTIRPGQTTGEQLKAIRWAVDLLESKLTSDGGYRTALKLVGGAR